jgi:hypothetical protein
MRAPYVARPASAVAENGSHPDRLGGAVRNSDNTNDIAKQAHVLAKAKPNSKHWHAYDVIFAGKTIVTDSRDPEHDLARALLARGIRGMVEIIDAKTGKTRTFVNVEAAAKWCVGSNLERYKWKVPERSDSSPHAAEHAEPLLTVGRS